MPRFTPDLAAAARQVETEPVDPFPPRPELT